MSITSGGQSYNPSFPVANTVNNSKGFRDNFATIKFAIERLQTAKTSGAPSSELNGTDSSVFYISASPDISSGAVRLKAEFNNTGFRLPSSPPSSPVSGSIYATNGVLYFHNGSSWRNFIERDGDTVTLTNLVVTNRATLNFVPTVGTDAVNKQWVEAKIAAIPQGGAEPIVFQRLSTLESGLSAEVLARSQEDTAIRGLINTQTNRVDVLTQRVSGVEQDINDRVATLNQRINSVETTANNVDQGFGQLSQQVSNLTQLVNSGGNSNQAAIDQERDARIAADSALSSRISAIENVALGDFTAAIEAERDARIAGDQALQTAVNGALTAVNTERNDRISQGNVTQNSIAALTDRVNDSNALVLSMDGRITANTTAISTETTNRNAAIISERNQRSADIANLQQQINGIGSTSDFLSKTTGGTVSAALGVTGDLTVGTGPFKLKVTAANGNLETRGRINADGDVVGLSDRSVKTDISRIENSLSKIKQLEGVLFRRSDLDDDRLYMGLIAQNTQRVTPEVVYEGQDGRLGVAYANLVALLVEGIKELSDQVEAIKDRLN